MRRSSLLGLVAMAMNTTAMAGGINLGTALVPRGVSGIGINRADLSSEQLQTLSRWLEQHRSGWHGMMTEASSESIQLQ